MATKPPKRRAEFDVIEPIGKRVVVRKDDNKRETNSGIVLPDSHEIPVITGRVIAISKAIENDEDQTIRKESDRQFAVQALTRVQEFNAFFGTRFSDEEYDTIGGRVLHQFGRQPRRGETVTMEGHEFKVLRADRRRIDQLRVTSPGPLPAEPGDGRGA